MADEFTESRNGSSRHEVVRYEGVSEIVNFGSVDTGHTEVAVNRGPDVSDEERFAGFGDEE